ncbi:MAG: phosphoribosylaminoimidazole succinocarboxamide synthase [Candidatus Lambdaproteobacteria bacterium]|nr:phosphoribosylaminoimidazole succinocarboxamide synthase [Candidatus Lambdaproteobacteria bacterium]
MDLIYAGSVKNLYLDSDPTQVWFEFTDDYSVFDWGKMPDPIPGKGENLARLGEWFFNKLTDPAEWAALELSQRDELRRWLPITHHFLRRESNRILVKRVSVPKLARATVGGNLVYDYGYAIEPRQLIPLEVIFRFGVPKGSSLLARKSWYPFDIHEGAEFPQPLIEFSTKLETRDRMLSYQEAAMVLKARPALLAEVHARTNAVALFLQGLFRRAGLKLWDGKLEWAFIDGAITLVDSIGPDELRVSAGEAVFSKQFLRDFYLGSPWEQAVQQGKALAHSRGSADWKAIVRNELQAAPTPLSPQYKETARLLYEDFRTILVDGQSCSGFVSAVSKLPPPR